VIIETGNYGGGSLVFWGCIGWLETGLWDQVRILID
jgi:hypothetical protein